ncbi:CerR family C-terminal domain-containing protein [Uliginosibacterium sp. H3]|uniref:CerR family C-terminal domain-containing protein n=1 Tax=Uliginosibacterium silvisoli TaxID=3114758 RepID=A0ABU6K8D7_9RHOO|nr:CerR family C-terminal domain-containing protein [Uliginosibacterium sp. H3]
MMTKSLNRRRTDGDATRERLLEAGGELFAADGYATTTAKAVAARAEVSLSLIHYYFGSREGLYQAVLIEAHRRLVDLDDLRRIAESSLSATAKLRAMIGGLVRQATRRQLGWHIHVLAKEVFAPSGHFPVLFQAEVIAKLSIVKQILSDITAIPADDPALVRCVVSVVAPCTMLLLGARGAPGPLDQTRRMPRKVVITHLHSFAIAGLGAIASEHGRRDQVPSR